MLRAVLLGTSQVDMQGISLSHKLVGKELALFAYLALTQELCPRSKLLDLLWTDVSEQKARENLRSLLYSLRQTIGDYLVVTRHAVGLNRNLPYWLDVEVFLSLPAQMDSHDLRFQFELLRLYTAELLDGFSISGAPVFDAWLAEQRDQLRTRAIIGWQQLVALYMERQQSEDALSANRRLLALAPWHEEAHRRQMQLLATTGQPSAALAHFEVCRQRLQDELDVPPSAETVNLYHQIKAQRELAPAVLLAGSPSEADRIPALSAAPAALFQQIQKQKNASDSPPALPTAPAAPPVSKPAQNGRTVEYRGAMIAPPTSWGRQDELDQLQKWIQVERCRCVAIVGVAGEGKTTLAHELVKTLTADDPTPPAFAGVIIFSCRHPLPIGNLLQDWLHTLCGRQIELPPTLDRQLDLLAEHIRRQAFLFVLDDFDHCFAEGGWASNADRTAFGQLWRLFLDRPHRCTLLLTARRLPPLQGLIESPGRFRQINLRGLEEEASRQLLKSYGLEGNPTDFNALHDCYAGNPLLLKLAAQTIDHLFHGSIAAFLQESAFFMDELGNLLEEHLSTLSPLEQTLLIWLALAGKPVSTALLWELLTPRPAKHAYFTALHNLSNASLIEIDNSILYIRSQYKEYIHCQLTDQLFDELRESMTSFELTGNALHDFALSPSVAQVEEANFSGLPVDSLLDRLQHNLGNEQLVAALRQFLVRLDSTPDHRTISAHRTAEPAHRVIHHRRYTCHNLTYLLAQCGLTKM